MCRTMCAANALKSIELAARFLPDKADNVSLILPNAGGITQKLTEGS